MGLSLGKPLTHLGSWQAVSKNIPASSITNFFALRKSVSETPMAILTEQHTKLFYYHILLRHVTLFSFHLLNVTIIYVTVYK